MNNNDIPVWEKYTLTIEEASKYFRIGENKLRRLAEENKDAGWLSRPRQHRHLKRKNSILFLVFLDFPHFFIHSGWQDTLF